MKVNALTDAEEGACRKLYSEKLTLLVETRLLTKSAFPSLDEQKAYIAKSIARLAKQHIDREVVGGNKVPFNAAGDKALIKHVSLTHGIDHSLTNPS